MTQEPAFNPDLLSLPKVGHFPSIPWIPYYSRSEQWPAKLVISESSSVRPLTESHQTDITPMSCADWFQLGDQFERLDNFGIAFRGKAGSVLFFSNEPWENLSKTNFSICDETTNSVRVLHALVTQKYKLETGVWTRDVNVEDPDTPRLLIQNQAVEELERKRFKYVYDIGNEWWNWQGTPIISAVWVYRKGMDPRVVNQVRELLHTARAEFKASPRAFIARHKAEHKWPMSVDTIEKLLHNFEYELGEEAERGIRRMREVLPKEVDALVPLTASKPALR